MTDAAEIMRSTCPNICKQCRPQCMKWQEMSALEGPKLMKYIKSQQEMASKVAGSSHKIEMAQHAARSSAGSSSQPKITCCGTCDIILQQISMLLTEIWDILETEQKVHEPCRVARSGTCQCQQCSKYSSQDYSQDFSTSSPKERYVSWLTRLRPILLSVLEGVKRSRCQIYKGEPKDELEKLLEQLRIPLRKQARHIRITSLTNIPLSPTERDAGLVTRLIENTALLEEVLAQIKNESDLIELKLRQEKNKAFDMHNRTGHLPELKPNYYYDATEKQPTRKTASALTISDSVDYVMFPPISGEKKPDRKEVRSDGATYTKKNKSEQPTDGTHTKEDEMNVKRDATFTKEEKSDKSEHKQHLAKTDYAIKFPPKMHFSDKDRRSRLVESYDKSLTFGTTKGNSSRSPPEKSEKPFKRCISPPGVLRVRSTMGTKQHAGMERTSRRTLEMKDKGQKGSPKADNIMYRGRWPKEPVPSHGDVFKIRGREKDNLGSVSKTDHLKTDDKKNQVKTGGKKGHVRTGSETDHTKTGSEKDQVKTGGKKGHVRTGSEKDDPRTGSEKDHLKTGDRKENVKTRSENDHVKTDDEKDLVKIGGEKNRGKTGSEKDHVKTGDKKSHVRTDSEKGHGSGSETSLTAQKDMSSKSGKYYYKGKPVTMKDEAQKGGLNVKVFKGGIVTKGKIKKETHRPGGISGEVTEREVPKEAMLRKKQASQKDPDLHKRRKTVVSEVPSNIILKRMNAERINELRLARQEARMQRAPPLKTKSIKSLPNVHMLLKKKKKKIKVPDSDTDTGITICAELEEPTEMIQGDIVVPLESLPKHEDTQVKPLLFKVEADFKDDEPISALVPSISALKATSKVDHKHKSEKTLPTLKSSKYKYKLDKTLDNKGVIVYKLSNPQFIDMGYTKLPSVTVRRKCFIYKMVQPNPHEDWFRRHIRHRVLYYDTCEKLAEIDNDGHGRWYYKNGRIALKFYAAEEKCAKNRYVIYSSGENDENGNPRCVTVLATFDHVGNGIVYDHGGNIRLKYNQNEGENYDRTIGATGRWKWHSLNISLSSMQNVYVEEHMKLGSQSTLNVIQEISKQGVMSDDLKTHKDDKKEQIQMITTEMENFMKETKELLQQKYRTFELKLKAFKLNEEFSLRIYEQKKIWLYFNVGNWNLKLNLGLTLKSTDILGTEMVHLHEIYTPFDRDIPESESISNILDIIRETRKQERKRNSGFKKYFSEDFKNTSTRLGVGVS